jgi:hypothetical protein
MATFHVQSSVPKVQYRVVGNGLWTINKSGRDLIPRRETEISSKPLGLNSAESVVFSATSSFRTTISSTDFSKTQSLTNFRIADHPLAVAKSGLAYSRAPDSLVYYLDIH